MTDRRHPDDSSRPPADDATPANGARVLRELVDQVRAEPAPELDFEAIETAMWARIDAGTDEMPASGLSISAQAISMDALSAAAPVEEHCDAETEEDARPSWIAPERPARESSPPEYVAESAEAQGKRPRGFRGTLVSWALAAAAAVAFGIPHALDAGGDEAGPVVRDLSALAEGDVVEATDGPVVFGTPGVVTWTLEEGGRLVVRDDVAGEHHVVALEEGSIRAEVTPRGLGPNGEIVEAFAVEVGETRVAVRGTVFTVSRVSPGIVVDVERGAVAVGQLGASGLTEGRLLRAAERASFSLDGGKTARRLARPGQDFAAYLETPLAEAPLTAPAIAEPLRGSLAGTKGSEEAAASEPAAPAPPDSAELPRGARAVVPPSVSPSTAQTTPSAPVALTVESLRQGLLGCFASVYQSRPDAVHLSVSTVFHLSVQADGSIQSARFVPPLKPEMADCAGQLIAGRFEAGPQQLQIPIQFQLGEP